MPNDNNNVGRERLSIFEMGSKITNSAGYGLCETGEAAENSMAMLNIYAKGGKFVAKTHVRVMAYGALGKEADKLSKLQDKYPNVKWETALNDLNL